MERGEERVNRTRMAKPKFSPERTWTIEENKEIVRRFFNEMVTGARLDLVDELVHPNFVRHFAVKGVQTDSHGREYMRGAIPRLHKIFEGFHERIIQILAEGDLVACRVDWGGRHVGTYLGVDGTDKIVDTESFRILRIQDGKVAEMWSLGDNYSQLIQMGALVPR